MRIRKITPSFISFILSHLLLPQKSREDKFCFKEHWAGAAKEEAKFLPNLVGATGKDSLGLGTLGTHSIHEIEMTCFKIV